MYLNLNYIQKERAAREPRRGDQRSWRPEGEQPLPCWLNGLMAAGQLLEDEAIVRLPLRVLAEEIAAGSGGAARKCRWARAERDFNLN